MDELANSSLRGVPFCLTNPKRILGPPVESKGILYPFSVVYFSRGTRPQKRVKEHYWGT